jgi:hypothetical protein
MRSTLHNRLHALAVVASLLTASLMPFAAYAAGNATYEFRPHCEGDDDVENVFGGPSPDVDGIMKLTEGTCRTFDVRDPSSLQTDVLYTGDTLDMDIVINNPDHRSISRFRAWVAYDPTILEGIDASISPSFPVPTPGESGFAPEEGTLKLSGTATSSVSKERFAVAHIRFRVLKDSVDGTPLIFTETTGDIDAKSGVFEGEIPNEQNTLSMTVGSLYVRLTGAASASSMSSMQTGIVNSSAVSSNDAHEAPASASAASTLSIGSIASAASSAMQKAFSLLQVLGLRVTTDGSSVFLAWDALPSSELAGYNVYYGTVSGRYIQRRTVDKAANSLTIRALPVGTTYYFAVRAYNAAGEETVFSQEVGVSVGNPKTSTSPLNANSLPTKTPPTGGTVAGETGVSSMLLILILSCAAVGTMIAVRRQMQISSAS